MDTQYSLPVRPFLSISTSTWYCVNAASGIEAGPFTDLQEAKEFAVRFNAAHECHVRAAEDLTGQLDSLVRQSQVWDLDPDRREGPRWLSENDEIQNTAEEVAFLPLTQISLPNSLCLPWDSPDDADDGDPDHGDPATWPEWTDKISVRLGAPMCASELFPGMAIP